MSLHFIRPVIVEVAFALTIRPVLYFGSTVIYARFPGR